MARPVTITLSHSLGKEEAITRIKTNFDKIKSSLSGGLRLKFTEEWEGDTLSFTAKGIGTKITGEIDAFPEHVRIVVVLPNFLASLAESISGQVEKKSGELLAPPNAN